VLQRLHCAGRTAGDTGDILYRKVSNESQCHHFPLIRREFSERRDEVRVEGLYGFTAIVQRQRPYVQGMPMPAAMFVDEAVVGDGEHPSSQVVVSALEVVDSPCDANEDLADQVFALVPAGASQIAMHRGSKCDEHVIDRARRRDAAHCCSTRRDR
jgi:hypothetical protein